MELDHNPFPLLLLPVGLLHSRSFPLARSRFLVVGMLGCAGWHNPALVPPPLGGGVWFSRPTLHSNRPYRYGHLDGPLPLALSAFRPCLPFLAVHSVISGWRCVAFLFWPYRPFLSF